MLATKVKICGITTADAGLCAAEAGADALGFVFYEPSPRHIEPSAAATIIAQLPPFLTTVGLFVNAAPDFVSKVVAETSLDLLQFHGDETNAFCCQFGKPFIKAVRVKSEQCIEQALVAFPSAKALLLDAYVEGIPGGTGNQFDWGYIPKDTTVPLILAGGLTPDNVADAVAQCSPYAVDVSGGVERSKGVKDFAKIRAFISTAKAAVIND